MVKLHTSQLNFGKLVKGKSGIGFIDTTVRTGNDFVKAYIAPTWEMVKGAREGKLDWYCDVYLARLEMHKDIILRTLESWAIKAQLTDVVLGCYDAEEKFCHRHLLKRFLLDNSKVFEKGGEVSKNTIFTGDVGNRAVILVAGDVDARKKLLRVLGTDIGAHSVSEIDETSLEIVEDRLAAIARIHERSAGLAKAGVMPYIDFTELGNVLKEVDGVVDSGGLLKSQGPRVGDDTPWHVVFGETAHADARKLMFTPAFELCPSLKETEFEKKMDDYYSRSIIDAKSGEY